MWVLQGDGVPLTGGQGEGRGGFSFEDITSEGLMRCLFGDSQPPAGKVRLELVNIV